jgi:hypothetical protein
MAHSATKWLDVIDVMRIPRTDGGTQGESKVLQLWCDQHQVPYIVFVAARDTRDECG